MEIRQATVEDGAAIADVHVRTWQAAYEHVFGADRLAGIDGSRRRAGWERNLAAGERAFVAEVDGRVVAFVSIGAGEVDGEGELFAIYALPEAWGSGAATVLMRTAVKTLRELGYREAVLWVLDDNPRARRFYEREGWALDGGTKEGEFLGMEVPEVRYRIKL
ncbi:MAG TPA: GNAT family N-acetyltransferase [Gaiellaceae bacterium]|nr:GNAT family N-acetyltransferase [Gaiellaceae bacterium]